MENHLLLAYLRAKYRIFNPELTIKVGEKNPLLDDLLEQYGATNWVFMTATNPRSEEFSAEENEKRHNELLFALEDEVSILIHEGESYGTNWKAEKSLLLINILADKAVKIAQKFGQNAILIGEKGEKARLFWVTD